MSRHRRAKTASEIRRSLIRLLTEAEKASLLKRNDPFTVESIADFIHEDALRVLRGARSMQDNIAPKLEAELLGLLLRHAAHLLPYWSARGSSEIITHEGVRRVLDIAVELFEKDGALSVSELFEALGTRGMKSAQAAVARLVNENDVHSKDVERAYVEIVEALQREHRRRNDDKFSAELRRLPLNEQLAMLRARANTGAKP